MSYEQIKRDYSNRYGNRANDFLEMYDMKNRVRYLNRKYNDINQYVTDVFNRLKKRTPKQNRSLDSFWEDYMRIDNRPFRDDIYIMDIKNVDRVKPVNLDLIAKIDENIQNLNNLRNVITRQNDLVNEVTSFVNNQTIGTLEGITRDAIAKHKIQPPNEIYESILEQPYSESTAMTRNRGGKKKQKQKTRKLRKKHNK